VNTVALFCLGLIEIVFQTTVFRLLAIPFLKAPLFISVVIYAAFHMEATRGLILSFVLGLAMDVYSGGIQGITPAVMVVLYLMGQWMSRDIFVEGKLALGLVAFCFGVIYSALSMGLEALVGGRALQNSIDVLTLFLQPTVLAIGCPILVSVAGKVDRLATIGWRRLQGLKT
jgi:rod shape-determining protein MreD